MERDHILDMRNVGYARQHGDPPLLQDVNLRLSPGEWVSLVGRNGSGKSTLIKLINGLLPLSSGTIQVNGQTLRQDTLFSIRQQVGMLFQNPDNQFVGMTVMEDIVFALENQGRDRETMQHQLSEAARRMGIGALLNRHPSELSGGQKQRAALAAVLAMEPKLVILDEATSMLDEQARQELVAILQELKAQGQVTILSVTHDVEEMLASDRVLALMDGKIGVEGPPCEVLCMPEVLEACHLKQPFLLELCHELRSRGIPVPLTGDVTTLLEALWAYDSNRLLTATRQQV